MAAMTTQEKETAARWVARHLFSDGTIASVNLTDLIAAVGAIDGAFEALPTALPNQLATVAANFNQSLPEPVKSALSTPKKGVLFVVTTVVKYGLVGILRAEL